MWENLLKLTYEILKLGIVLSVPNAKRLSVRLRTKWFWVRVQLQSLGIVPSVMKTIFQNTEKPCAFRSQVRFKTRNAHSVRYDMEITSYIGLKLSVKEISANSVKDKFLL